MPYQKKQNETLYHGQSRWLRVPMNYVPKEGEEVIDTNDTVKKVERNGFEITYLMYFFELFDKLGGAKYKVVQYIIKNKSADNTLIITIRELAKATGTSTKTVHETLKLLEESGLIKTRTGAIMIEPRLAHRGSDKKEAYLLQKFVAFGEE